MVLFFVKYLIIKMLDPCSMGNIRFKILINIELTFSKIKKSRYFCGMNKEKWVYIFLWLLCCVPFVSASVALLLGVGLALAWGNPWLSRSKTYSQILLKSAVVGLGFGVNLGVLLKTGQENLFSTTLFVFGVLLAGLWLGRWLGLPRKIAVLISAGTAICGGSAIATIGSVIKADSKEMSVSTATIFLLNALGLVIFPFVGRLLSLSETEFGTWAAIAIHDTSSVVGAAAKYGDEALHVASVTKMLRILWIIPMAIGASFWFTDSERKITIPAFIFGFLATSGLTSLFPEYQPVYQILYKIGKQGLVVSLFMIGSNISFQDVKNVGFKAIAQAVILWLIVSVAALIFVRWTF
jgi:uncharacterized integral membrane protein (TIGR00698 family)